MSCWTVYSRWSNTVKGSCLGCSGLSAKYYWTTPVLASENCNQLPKTKCADGYVNSLVLSPSDISAGTCSLSAHTRLSMGFIILPMWTICPVVPPHPVLSVAALLGSISNSVVLFLHVQVQGHVHHAPTPLLLHRNTVPQVVGTIIVAWLYALCLRVQQLVNTSTAVTDTGMHTMFKCYPFDQFLRWHRYFFHLRHSKLSNM